MGVTRRYPVPSDIEIAQETVLDPIEKIAARMGIKDEELEPYGKYMAKVDYQPLLERLKSKPNGKFITVTAITPTPLGEGKTVTSLTLGQALAKMGLNACNALREPSKGPTFGIKGGACGGGYSQMLPMENINLHFTGDIHAAESANNLAAAAVDNSITHGNKLGIDPCNVTWVRGEDLNDRALRDIVVGLGGKVNGYPRQTGYSITVATEPAAIHALTSGLADLRARFARTVIGYSYANKPVTCEDLKVAGAMTALMVDAIKPNLVQSTENHPVFCSGFPFANVAHGNNSVLADLVALKLCDYVVSESGFASDNGFVKLMDVVVRQSHIPVDCAVIVASIRALKQHGGAYHFRPGMKYSAIKAAAETENPDALRKGCENLAQHIKIVKAYGVHAVVAINRFTSDTDKEVELIRQLAIEAGAEDAVPHEGWAKGGEGGLDLAKAVVKACDKPTKLQFLYADDAPIKEKIEANAVKLYGADGVDYQAAAEERIKLFTSLGYNKLCLNVAKTHLSLSHDPNLLNAPRGWRLPVRDIKANVGAGFLYPLTGVFPTMPGLPSEPAFIPVDVDLKTGKIKGLF
ncbi:MAG: formate--tetrahydrofolate ligase [Chloroflexi bacterium]|nr:formate--tetrahydrofolate ligase [Chloroflexota bacterium]